VCKDDSHYLAELKQQKSKRLILLRSTLTLWQCAAKVISAFLISAVLVLRDNDCRPYTPFQTVKFFTLIKIYDVIQSTAWPVVSNVCWSPIIIIVWSVQWNATDCTMLMLTLYMREGRCICHASQPMSGVDGICVVEDRWSVVWEPGQYTTLAPWYPLDGRLGLTHPNQSTSHVSKNWELWLLFLPRLVS